QWPGRDDGPAAGDVCGRADVAVLERGSRRLADYLAADPLPAVVARLHGDLGDTGQVAQAHDVADHGDLRMTGDGQVVLNGDAPGPVLLGSRRLRDGGCERRRRDPGRPQHRCGVELFFVTLLVADCQSVLRDIGNQGAHVHFYAQFVQRLGGP